MRRVAKTPLPELKGIARLLLLDSDLTARLKQGPLSFSSGRRLPSLRDLYAERNMFSGYGGDTAGGIDNWTSIPALPSDDDIDRQAAGWWWSMQATGESATEESRGALAWRLIVPSAEEGMIDMSSVNRQWQWEEILDAERDNLTIPRRLTWEFGERAREYLNATEEFLDRDYFAPAYEKADSAPKHDKMMPPEAAVDSLLPLMATAVAVPYDDESVDSDATIPPSPLAAEQYDSEEY